MWLIFRKEWNIISKLGFYLIDQSIMYQKPKNLIYKKKHNVLIIIMQTNSKLAVSALNFLKRCKHHHYRSEMSKSGNAWQKSWAGFRHPMLATAHCTFVQFLKMMPQISWLGFSQSGTSAALPKQAPPDGATCCRFRNLLWGNGDAISRLS